MPDGPGRDLRPRVDLQLAHDVADVAVHGALGEHQRLGDLAVGPPLHDQRGDLPLARGQLDSVGVRQPDPPGLGAVSGISGSAGAVIASAYSTTSSNDIARPSAQARGERRLAETLAKQRNVPLRGAPHLRRRIEAVSARSRSAQAKSRAASRRCSAAPSVCAGPADVTARRLRALDASSRRPGSPGRSRSASDLRAAEQSAMRVRSSSIARSTSPANRAKRARSLNDIADASLVADLPRDAQRLLGQSQRPCRVAEIGDGVALARGAHRR